MNIRYLGAVLVGVGFFLGCGGEPAAKPTTGHLGGEPASSALDAGNSTDSGSGGSADAGTGSVTIEDAQSGARQDASADASAPIDASASTDAGASNEGGASQDAGAFTDASAPKDASASDASASADAFTTTDAGTPNTSTREICSARFRTAAGGSSGIGRRGWETENNVHVDRADNVIVAAVYVGSITFGSTVLTAIGPSSFVVKLDTNCQLLWAKSFGGDKDTSVTLGPVASDSAGNLYVGGTFGGVFNLAEPLRSLVRDSAVVIKLDPQGNVLWNKGFISLWYDSAVKGVQVDSHGHVIISGVAPSDVSFGGLPIGGENPAGSGFVAQLDAAGVHRWSRSVNATYDPDVALARDDTIVLSGRSISQGSASRNLVKLADTGTDVWVKAGPPALVDPLGMWEGRVEVDGSGHILLGHVDAQTDGTSVLNSAAAITKLSPAGEKLWSRAVPVGASLFFDAWSAKLAVDSAGAVFHSVMFSEPTAYAGKTYAPRGETDLLLIKLDATGEPLWTHQLGDQFYDSSFGMSTDSQRNLFVAYGSVVIPMSQDELVVVKLSP